jgi:hypothetical protein
MPVSNHCQQVRVKHAARVSHRLGSILREKSAPFITGGFAPVKWMITYARVSLPAGTLQLLCIMEVVFNPCHLLLRTKQNTGHSHNIKIVNKSVENVAEFKYLGTTSKEIKITLNSVHNFVPTRLLYLKKDWNVESCYNFTCYFVLRYYFLNFGLSPSSPCF